MADKKTKIYELEELTTPVSNDLLVINDSSTSEDKKVKLKNLISNDTIETAVDNWLDAHPEATTTVEDGAISEAKLNSTLADKINRALFIDNDGLFYALVDES